MILRKSYKITDWKRWDRQIDSAAKEFFEITGRWPNILLANDSTLDRIDLLANQSKENIRYGSADKTVEDPLKADDWRELGGFQGKNYSIEFCVDPALPSKTFSLIFDPNPDGDGGEPVPEFDNVGLGERPRKRRPKAS